jgi:hypothetical protein
MSVETTAEELRFPALIVAKTGVMLVVRNKDELQTTNTLALRSRFFDNLLAIDITGQTYEVVGVTVQGTVGPLWGIRFLKPRRVRVSLRLLQASRLPLQAIQELAIAAINREPHTWEDRGEVPELARRIRATQSVQALLELLS